METRGSIRPAKPTSFARFEVTTSCFGFEVSDADGRPVTEPFEYEWQAQAAAEELNNAAASGPKAFAAALGAITDEEAWEEA